MRVEQFIIKYFKKCTFYRLGIFGVNKFIADFYPQPTLVKHSGGIQDLRYFFFGRRRHARAGDKPHLWRREGTPEQVLILPESTRCWETFPVSFSVVDPCEDGRWTIVNLTINQMRMAQRQTEAFAVLDGFADAEAMGAWFRKTHGAGRFEGTWVLWSPVAVRVLDGRLWLGAVNRIGRPWIVELTDVMASAWAGNLLHDIGLCGSSLPVPVYRSQGRGATEWVKTAEVLRMIRTVVDHLQRVEEASDAP